MSRQLLNFDLSPIDLELGLWGFSPTGPLDGARRTHKTARWSGPKALESRQKPSTMDGRLRDGMCRRPSTGVSRHDA